MRPKRECDALCDISPRREFSQGGANGGFIKGLVSNTRTRGEVRVLPSFTLGSESHRPRGREGKSEGVGVGEEESSGRLGSPRPCCPLSPGEDTSKPACPLPARGPRWKRELGRREGGLSSERFRRGNDVALPTIDAAARRCGGDGGSPLSRRLMLLPQQKSGQVQSRTQHTALL